MTIKNSLSIHLLHLAGEDKLSSLWCRPYLNRKRVNKREEDKMARKTHCILWIFHKYCGYEKCVSWQMQDGFSGLKKNNYGCASCHFARGRFVTEINVAAMLWRRETQRWRTKSILKKEFPWIYKSSFVPICLSKNVFTHACTNLHSVTTAIFTVKRCVLRLWLFSQRISKGK